MNSENVIISTVFKGGSANNAELSSRDVINTIEGFEESIQLISSKIYGKECNVNCNLKAPKEGSFELEYIFSIAGVVPALLNSVNIRDLPNIIAGLYEIHIKINGKKTKEIVVDNRGGINIKAEDNSTINIAKQNIYNFNLENVAPEVLKEILNNDDIRKSTTKSLSPVANKRVDKIIYKNSEKQELMTIENKDCSSFALLNERITEEEKEMQLYIKSPSFDGKRWTFENKNNSSEYFTALIEDDGFQKKVIEGSEFKNGDEIIADVFIKYSDKPKKKNIYKITKVLHFIKAPLQPTIQ